MAKVENEDEEFVLASYEKKDDEDHSFGGMMIHSLVETIEYSLGTISNTASYLRLWALSLAHSRLSSVFSAPLNMTVSRGETWVDYVLLFIGFYVFFGVIFGLIIVMDQMECHLHTVRLVWVEFMNKFYESNGNEFQIYNLDEVLEQSIQEQD